MSKYIYNSDLLDTSSNPVASILSGYVNVNETQAVQIAKVCSIANKFYFFSNSLGNVALYLDVDMDIPDINGVVPDLIEQTPDLFYYTGFATISVLEQGNIYCFHSVYLEGCAFTFTPRTIVCNITADATDVNPYYWALTEIPLSVPYDTNLGVTAEADIFVWNDTPQQIYGSLTGVY